MLKEKGKLGEEHGYVVFRQVIPNDAIQSLHKVLRSFHKRWLAGTSDTITGTAVNSAYLTTQGMLTEPLREQLFKFISSRPLLDIVERFIPSPAFLNTQLFFNPQNPSQRPYWHRDIQYGHSDDEQKHKLAQGGLMPHFRIPVAEEKGIELIPGSHRRWDTELEYAVRMEQKGKKNYFPLPHSEVIHLTPGDVLMFCGKLLHRGRYSPNRFAFDVLYASADSEYLNTVTPKLLPAQTMDNGIVNAPVFARTFDYLNCG